MRTGLGLCTRERQHPLVLFGGQGMPRYSPRVVCGAGGDAPIPPGLVSGVRGHPCTPPALFVGPGGLPGTALSCSRGQGPPQYSPRVVCGAGGEPRYLPELFLGSGDTPVPPPSCSSHQPSPMSTMPVSRPSAVSSVDDVAPCPPARGRPPTPGSTHLETSHLPCPPCPSPALLRY